MHSKAKIMQTKKDIRILNDILNGNINDYDSSLYLRGKLDEMYREGRISSTQYERTTLALEEAKALGGRVAVIIPCLDEEKTIKKVVEDYKRVLPRAHIYVYDNGSTDNTVINAREADAFIGYCETRGKGAVIRKALSEIKADAYVLCDGDGTYPPRNVREMLYKLKDNPHSLVIGNRYYESEAMSFTHKIGNRIVRFISGLKHAELRDVDIMSGCRAFGKDFAESFVGKYDGFEVETEMTLFAVQNQFKIETEDIPYVSRPEGSISKINTVKDGLKILKVLIRGK